jgi:hypothetical protein
MQLTFAYVYAASQQHGADGFATDDVVNPAAVSPAIAQLALATTGAERSAAGMLLDAMASIAAARRHSKSANIWRDAAELVRKGAALPHHSSRAKLAGKASMLDLDMHSAVSASFEVRCRSTSPEVCCRSTLVALMLAGTGSMLKTQQSGLCHSQR